MSLLLTGAGSSFSGSGAIGPINDGLVLYVDGGRAASYPGTGTTWFDLAGDNDLTFENPGDIIHFPSGYFFTGETGYWSRASASVPTTGTYTFSAVVRTNGEWDDAGVYSLGVPGDPNRFNWVATRQDSLGKVEHSWWTSGIDGVATDIAVPWYVLSSTWDGTTRKLWKNGTLLASDTPASGPNVNNPILYVANVNTFVGYKWASDFAAFMTYDRALSQAELTSNANYFISRLPVEPTPPLPAALIVYETFNDPLVYEAATDYLVYE